MHKNRLATRAIVATTVAATFSATLLVGSSHAAESKNEGNVETQADTYPWKCESSSHESPNDAGGRDNLTQLRNPDKSTEYVLTRFVAHGEHMYAQNDTKNFSTEHYARFQKGGKWSDYSWYWLTRPGDRVHDNLDLAEGWRVQLQTSPTPVGTVGTCINNNGKS